MSVDELARLRLANKAVHLFGEEEAQTLMEHLPLGGITNLATKNDLLLTKAELRGDFQELRADFERLRADVAESMRRQTITMITIMTTINAVMFAGLKWG